MRFLITEPIKISDIKHINAHVSYLMTCDSQLKNDIDGAAIKDLFIIKDLNNNYKILKGLDDKERCKIAKDIRKTAKESLNSLTDRMIQSKLRTQLIYIDGVNKRDLLSGESYEDVLDTITSFIDEYEVEANSNDEISFAYTFHYHQLNSDEPHIHRFFKIK